MIEQAMGVFCLARRHSSRCGRDCPDGAGQRAPRLCRELSLPWSGATSFFFRSDRSFPISVIDLVAMGLWREIGPFGWLGRKRQARIDEAIAAAGLTGFELRSIGSLSGGQMQRALFARLLLQDAQLVLLDEPFTAIDARTMADLIGVVRDWHGEGRTVLAVLHDHETVRTHFPQTLMLARELVAHGPTNQVLTAENQFRARQMCEACVGPPHVCGRSAA